MSAGARVTFLGPQRFRPTLAATLRSLGVEGPVATITAGWQEREEEDAELHEHLGGASRNLRLYARAEELFAADPALAAAHRARQERLAECQELYRLRLGFAAGALAELMAREGAGGILAAERESAMEALRALDAEHAARVAREHAAFEAEWRPAERPAVRHAREAVASALEGASAVAVAGGHVAVLLNRLRLFDLAPLLGERTVVAWSAGAMALSERVVLFHDSPPEGPGRAEILDVGLGLFPGVVPLPHARKRLDLDDAPAMSRLALRFAGARCVALDPGARLDWNGSRWSAEPETLAVLEDGRLARAAA